MRARDAPQGNEAATERLWLGKISLDPAIETKPAWRIWSQVTGPGARVRADSAALRAGPPKRGTGAAASRLGAHRPRPKADPGRPTTGSLACRGDSAVIPRRSRDYLTCFAQASIACAPNREGLVAATRLGLRANDGLKSTQARDFGKTRDRHASIAIFDSILIAWH